MPDVDMNELRDLCKDVAKLNQTNQFVIKVQTDALLASQRYEEKKYERETEEGSASQRIDGTSA